MIEKNPPIEATPVSNTLKGNNIGISEVVVNDILKKLNNFEQKKGFIKKGLTQQELAKSFTTNTTYLSFVINEF